CEPVVPLAPAAPAVRPSRTAVPRKRPAGPWPRSALAIAIVSVVIIVVVERAEHLVERRRRLRLDELVAGRLFAVGQVRGRMGGGVDLFQLADGDLRVDL